MGKMKDFGLKNSQYTIEKVERDGGKSLRNLETCSSTFDLW